MDPMRAALAQKRKMSSPPPDMDEGYEDQKQTPESGENGGLKQLVASLSDDQKNELMSLLKAETTDESADIAKGEPSQDERQAIDAQMAKDDAESAAEDKGEADESDDIAMSMLDHNSMNAQPGTQPRNLSERVKMSLASKLRSKGKIK